jgi:hypothetical protein
VILKSAQGASVSTLLIISPGNGKQGNRGFVDHGVRLVIRSIPRRITRGTESAVMLEISNAEGATQITANRMSSENESGERTTQKEVKSRTKEAIKTESP